MLKLRGSILAVVVILLAGTMAPRGEATGRAVSLNALAAALKAGRLVEAQSLCGMTRVTGYLVDGSTRDVILIGEVAPSLPPLHAADLAVALRNTHMVYAQVRGGVRYYCPPGCSIDPDPDVLDKLRRVGGRLSRLDDEESRRTVLEEWQSIGRRPQKVRVMGVPFDSRFAKVMVDADFYMKRLVNGSVDLNIEGFESLDEMNERAAKEALAAGKWDAVPQHTLNRFWFSPGETTYDVEDGVTILKSCSIRLLTEEEFLTSRGRIGGMGRPHPLAARFARGFTDHWESIASARPIYRELESLFRFVALARLLKDANIRCPGLTYLVKSHRLQCVPVSRAVLGLTSVREVVTTLKTQEGEVKSRMWFTSCGGVSMDLRPKRVQNPPRAKSPTSASAPSSRTARRAYTAAKPTPAAAAAPVGLKKAILGARRSPGTLYWDFD